MKTELAILISTIGLLTSCYEVYGPEIDTANKVLVVNGMITNKMGPYHVILSYANPFNSKANAEPVNNANVFVTDNEENQYIFNEETDGDYISDSLQFAGIPGRSYKLHIATSDGAEYESESQLLFPETQADSVYAEFNTKETLDRNSGLTVSTHGADILADLLSKSDSIIHYRFTSSLVIQYFYYVTVYVNWNLWFELDFYCWKTVNANSNINLTGGEYALNSGSYKKHETCFLDDNSSVRATRYDYKLYLEDTTASSVFTHNYQSYLIHHRILFLNQYTLNNETYLYYKSMDEQMQSEGKLFDPIAAQLNGNIKCISDPDKRAIGFFEASSVNNSAFIVDFRNLIHSQPSLIRTPYILPPAPNGCQTNKPGSIHNNIPKFWIF